MGNTTTSVQNLVSELSARIELLTSTQVRANLNPKTFNKITDIIKKYTKRTPQELKPQDIALFKVDDMKLLLETMGVNNEEINRIIIRFNPNVYKYQSGDISVEIDKYFEKIRNMIVNYILDYQDINNNQQAAQNEKVAEYRRYITLLTSKTLEEPFDDFEGLIKLMSTLAIPSEDKWKILVHVAEQNLRTAKLSMSDINYAKKISDLVTKYIKPNPELVSVVEKALYRNDTDIDLIPTLAENIAKDTEASVEVVQNIIVTILAVNVHKNYINVLETNKPSADNLKDMLDAILEQLISPDLEIINRSSAILDENASLIATSKDILDADILRYVDKSLSEIEEEGRTREEAIDYKKLPILKTLAETLDKVSTLTEEDNDYLSCIEILKGLNESYASIINRMEKELLK